MPWRAATSQRRSLFFQAAAPLAGMKARSTLFLERQMAARANQTAAAE
jgi:hypothetical protein